MLKESLCSHQSKPVDIGARSGPFLACKLELASVSRDGQTSQVVITWTLRSTMRRAMTSMTTRWPSIPLRHRVCRGHKHESTCKEDGREHDCDISSLWKSVDKRRTEMIFIQQL